MDEKALALRLADLIEAGQGDAKVAAELRRLHAENERLHQINWSHEVKLSVRGYELQIEDLRLAHAELRERNAELLEALKRIAKIGDQPYGTDYEEIDAAREIARAAIAKATEEPK